MVEHYYTPKPTGKLKLRLIKTILKGKKYIFRTGSGTFSPTKIDLGTKILIENALVKKDDKLLDLGCGYGPVGITFANKAQVTMTDVNERATSLARQNAKLNNVEVKIKTGNIYEPIKNEKFDVILLNPPQTAGRKICNQMIKEAKQHLTKGGTLQIVARHQKGGKQLEKIMRETFGNAEQIVKQSGYRIYLSKQLN